MTNKKLMEEAPVWKLILKMSLPMVVIMLMNVVYNMADTFFMGQTGSAALVASVSLSGPVFGALSGFNVLLGSGACTAIALALGKGETNRIRQYTSFCFWAALGFGILAGAAILAGMGPLVRLLGANAETAPHTAAYLRVLALGAPISMVGGMLGNAARGDGSSIAPMALGLAGNLVNILLDPLFILVFHWGVTGAALATVCGNAVSCAGILWIMLRKKELFSFSPRQFTWKPDVSLRVLSLGLPMAAGIILQSCSGVFGNQLLVRYGNTAVAASKVAGMSGMLLGMLVMGVCMGVQPAISYVFGTGSRQRLKKILWGTGTISVVLGACLAVGFYLCRDSFMAAFLNDPQVVELGRLMMLGSLVTAPVFGLYQLASSYLQATGQVTFATVTSLLRQGLVYVPVLYLLETAFGLMGLVFAAAVSDVISTAISGIFCFRKPRQIQQAVC